MKIKADYVTNSSSTSFVIISDDELGREKFYEWFGIDPESDFTYIFSQLFDAVKYNAYFGHIRTPIPETSGQHFGNIRTPISETSGQRFGTSGQRFGTSGQRFGTSGHLVELIK